MTFTGLIVPTFFVSTLTQSSICGFSFISISTSSFFFLSSSYSHSLSSSSHTIAIFISRAVLQLFRTAQDYEFISVAMVVFTPQGGPPVCQIKVILGACKFCSVDKLLVVQLLNIIGSLQPGNTAFIQNMTHFLQSHTKFQLSNNILFSS